MKIAKGDWLLGLYFQAHKSPSKWSPTIGYVGQRRGTCKVGLLAGLLQAGKETWWIPAVLIQWFPDFPHLLLHHRVAPSRCGIIPSAQPRHHAAFGDQSPCATQAQASRPHSPPQVQVLSPALLDVRCGVSITSKKRDNSGGLDVIMEHLYMSVASWQGCANCSRT